MSTIIDGAALAKIHQQRIAKDVQELKSKTIQPGLAFILVGDHPASQIYVRHKQTACDTAGIHNLLVTLPSNTTEDKLLEHIDQLNNNKKIHGILIQLPLPLAINTKKVLARIHPKKDVDGLHPLNLGLLYLNMPGLKPCTPQGILHLIESTGVEIRGKDVCVVGRSAIVGRPIATMLAKLDATVTLCHRHTQNLHEKIRQADIVVVAIGRPRYIQGDWIKNGAIVIDVGINRLPNGKIVGDVDFEAACKHAGFITPVPGGVGPMTIAMLLKNTLEACKNIEGIL